MDHSKPKPVPPARTLDNPPTIEHPARVIEAWRGWAGETVWTKALQEFADLGGKILWWGGIPQSCSTIPLCFVLYLPNGEEHPGSSRLRDIRDAIDAAKEQVTSSKERTAADSITRQLDRVNKMVPARYSQSRDCIYGPAGEPILGLVKCQERLQQLGVTRIVRVKAVDQFEGFTHFLIVSNGWQIEEYLVTFEELEGASRKG